MKESPQLTSQEIIDAGESLFFEPMGSKNRRATNGAILPAITVKRQLLYNACMQHSKGHANAKLRQRECQQAKLSRRFN